jgi:Glycosyltransferase family 87
VTAQQVRAFANIFAVVVLTLLAIDWTRHLGASYTNAAGEQLGRDFGTFWSGTRLALCCQASAAYDPNSLLSYDRAFFGSNAEFKLYTYPPVALLLTLPFGLLPYWAGFALWLVLGTALCAFLLSRSIGWQTALPLIMGAPAAFVNYYAGQNGQFTAILLATGLAVLEERPVLAGVCFGLLSAKPQLALLLPFALLAGRHYRAFVSAMLTAAAAIGTSLAVFGVGTWEGFYHQVCLIGRLLRENATYWPRMPTVFAALRVLGIDVSTAFAFQGLSALLALALVIRIWRSRCPPEIKSAAVLVATFLATPYAWGYDMVVLIFAAVWLAVAIRPLRRLDVIVAIIVLLLPWIEVVATKATGVPVGPAVLWTAAILLYRHSNRDLIQSIPSNRHGSGSTPGTAYT